MAGRLALLSTLFFCLVGCSETFDRSSGFFGLDTKRNFRASGASSREPATGGERESLSRGTDEFIDRDALFERGPSRAVIDVVDDDLVEINLINASIEAAAQAVLSETLGLQSGWLIDSSGTARVHFRQASDRVAYTFD